MNKLLATVAIIGSVSFAASANAQEYATITNVTPNYQTISTPNTRQVCNVIEVPVYGRSGGQASTGDTLFGALIGGALGNQVGGGKGKDAATVLGAIIGADVANKRSGSQQVIGYRQEQRCNNVTSYSTQQQIQNYTIRYEWNGIRSRSVTYNQYSVGDQIPVSVSINAN